MDQTALFGDRLWARKNEDWDLCLKSANNDDSRFKDVFPPTTHTY